MDFTPDWPAPPHVKALFTTRAGGVSAAPFDSLNLGDHVGDQPADVAVNRQVLQSTLAARPVFLQQVHGISLADLTLQTPNGTVADACMTTQTGVACTIMVADCLPVLFTDVDGSFVAAAHAGWRGLANGVLQNTLNTVKQQFEGHFMPLAGVNIAYDATKIIAWLGPCIGPTAFEVGDEVRAAFVDESPLAATQFQTHGAGKWLANLPGLARLQLQLLGVTNIYGNDGSLPWCTFTQSSRFFSHRRDAAVLGSSGRMAACVWRV
ncbi:MAG: peptidoglycan editing factor PgeF [Burkholderiaceae bacterium]